MVAAGLIGLPFSWFDFRVIPVAVAAGLIGPPFSWFDFRVITVAAAAMTARAAIVAAALVTFDLFFDGFFCFAFLDL